MGGREINDLAQRRLCFLVPSLGMGYSTRDEEQHEARLDDVSLHAESEGMWMDLLERFFQICEKHGLFLSAKKCVCFSRRLKLCGRIIAEDITPSNPFESRYCGIWKCSQQQQSYHN